MYALRATLRAADMARALANGEEAAVIAEGIEAFDSACPNAKHIRDVIEHFDEYYIGRASFRDPSGTGSRSRSSTKALLIATSCTSARSS